MGLISYSNNVTVDASLQDGLAKDKMIGAIKALLAWGPTNMAGGLDEADSPSGLNPRKPDDKVEQYVVLFTDGMPTAYRGGFLFMEQTIDVVAAMEGPKDIPALKDAINCRPGATGYDHFDMNIAFLKPDILYGKAAYFVLGYTDIRGQKTSAYPTWYAGDGLLPTINLPDQNYPGHSKCGLNNRGTVKWYGYAEAWGGPVPGYSVDSCIIANWEKQDVLKHHCTLARNLTIVKADELKAKGIKIYVVGLGTDVDIDLDLLKLIASTPTDKYLFTTANSSELEGIFNKIAKQIKLRLVM